MNQLEAWEQAHYNNDVKEKIEKIKQEFLKEYEGKLNTYEVQFVNGVFAYITNRL